MKGVIVHWVDERGFGFINSDEFDGDIFVHISKFKRGYRRPQFGDLVEFQLENNQPNLGAKSVVLVGVKPKRKSRVFSAVFFGCLGTILYLFIIEEPKSKPTYEHVSFSCQGKTYCREMVSCDEAKFYLSNCPNVKIDGDNDGIPCERQLCDS
ncbi:cold shock domain-containing protein [Vibrio owensii]|uniref:cold shock domain-containing protein n=1 Tax=Vibrio owensii TaxID=696485 RepID=UPI00221E73A2|nr:cold shock domain-containing protein [Vibrio owensii]